MERHSPVIEEVTPVVVVLVPVVEAKAPEGDIEMNDQSKVETIEEGEIEEFSIIEPPVGALQHLFFFNILTDSSIRRSQSHTRTHTNGYKFSTGFTSTDSPTTDSCQKYASSVSSS
jgi:hypothetical protein